MSSHYCVHGDVSTFMQVTFGSGGLPSTGDVTSLINEVEQRIDNETDHAWNSNRYATATEFQLFAIGRKNNPCAKEIWHEV